MTLLLVWLLNAVALLVVAYLLPGITVASFGSALIAALVLGLLNSLVKPVLVLLTLPVIVLWTGLGWWPALIADLGLAAAYVAYAFVFNIAYDRLFPITAPTQP